MSGPGQAADRRVVVGVALAVATSTVELVR